LLDNWDCNRWGVKEIESFRLLLLLLLNEWLLLRNDLRLLRLRELELALSRLSLRSGELLRLLLDDVDSLRVGVDVHVSKEIDSCLRHCRL
jgi:hypothetical protein